jgi:hypothetical protein
VSYSERRLLENSKVFCRVKEGGGALNSFSPDGFEVVTFAFLTKVTASVKENNNFNFLLLVNLRESFRKL